MEAFPLRPTVRAFAFLVLMLLPSFPQAPASPATEHGSFDQSWLQPGYVAFYEGNPVNVGQGADPMRWWRFSHAVLDRSGDNLTLHAVGVQLQTGQVRTFTLQYDVPTRREVGAPGRSAALWVNDADVRAGRARIGEHEAVLSSVTGEAFVFSTAGTDYHYDRSHGILVKAEDRFTVASAALAIDRRALHLP